MNYKEKALYIVFLPDYIPGPIRPDRPFRPDDEPEPPFPTPDWDYDDEDDE